MSQSFQFLIGGGNMGEVIGAQDWQKNPLGPIETWPSALKIALGMALNSRFPKCVVWGPDLITLHNDAFTPILGEKPSALGRSFRDVWSEAWAEIGPIAERAFAGEPTFIENFPLIIDRHGYPEQSYFTFCYSPIRDEHGIVRGMMDTVIETTATVEAEKHARLLSAELSHRIKNTLAIVSTIVRQTLNATESRKEAGLVLEQRIDALAKAQSILSNSRRADGDMREAVNHALRPFRSRDDQFVIDGPPVWLSAGQVFTMMLALNELATNALKYGALSHADGQVHLCWSAGRPNTADPFRFVWAEVNGPPVRQVARKGFGSRILKDVIPVEFMGESVLSLDSTGIRFELMTQMNRLGCPETD